MNRNVSVVIPTHNRKALLQRAVNSVVRQIYPDWELWIIDDGSTDDTIQWFRQLLGELPAHQSSQMHLVRSPQRGVSHARNLGIQLSSFPWIAFLDSDDEWLPHKLKEQMDLAQKYPHLKTIHGEEFWVRHGLRVNPKKKHKKLGGRIFIPSLKLCCISPSTVLIHREVFKTVGLFREDFPVCEDYDLWLKITSHYEVGFCEKPLIIKYGGHEDQLSHRYKAMDHWRVVALLDRLKSTAISPQEREKLIEEILYKSAILKKGYEKYGRTDELKSLHQKLKDHLVRNDQFITNHDSRAIPQ